MYAQTSKLVQVVVDSHVQESCVDPFLCLLCLRFARRWLLCCWCLACCCCCWSNLVVKKLVVLFYNPPFDLLVQQVSAVLVLPAVLVFALYQAHQIVLEF